MIRFIKCLVAGFRAAWKGRLLCVDSHYLTRLAMVDAVHGLPATFPDFRCLPGVTFDEISATRCRWRVSITSDDAARRRRIGGAILVLEDPHGRALGNCIVRNVQELAWVVTAWSNSAELFYCDFGIPRE